jgi:hypothetical protein
LYQSTLLEDALRSGIPVVYGALQPEDVEAASHAHALMVIASGRGCLAEMFPPVAEQSPYPQPQRRLFAGLFHGLAPTDAAELAFRISPGHGEVFAFAPFVTFEGPVSALLVEAIPGGDLEPLTHADVNDFERMLLEALHVHAPGIVERIDPATFEPTRPQDVHRGAIVPVVRRGYRLLESGVYAQAIGDAHVLNDPILGQGANAASFAAATLAEAIVGGGPFDMRFCETVEWRILAHAGAAAEWSNAALQPPPPHVLELFRAAADNTAVANAIAGNFGAPQRAWSAFGSHEGAAQFLREFERAAA